MSKFDFRAAVVNDAINDVKQPYSVLGDDGKPVASFKLSGQAAVLAGDLKAVKKVVKAHPIIKLSVRGGTVVEGRLRKGAATVVNTSEALTKSLEAHCAQPVEETEEAPEAPKGATAPSPNGKPETVGTRRS